MPVPTFSDASEAYRYYSQKGGIVGILNTILDKLRRKEDETIKRANEVYLRAFPRGKPIKTLADIGRRVGIFSIHARRKPEIKPLFEEFKKLHDVAHKIRDLYSIINRNKGFIDTYRIDVLEGKPTPPTIKSVVEKILRAINAILNITHYCYQYFKEDFEEEYYLARLNLQHSAHLYTRYESSIRKNRRAIEFIFIAYTHAELLYLEDEYDITLGTIGEWEHDLLQLYAAAMEYYYLGLPPRYGTLYAFFGISLSNMKYKYNLEPEYAVLLVFDVDYGEERYKHTSKKPLPFDYFKYDPLKVLQEYFELKPTYTIQLKLTGKYPVGVEIPKLPARRA